ncbi:HYR domain-containing protein [Chloroflexus aurantiacus]
MRPRWIALALGAIWLLLATIPAISTAHMSSTPVLDTSAGISARSSLNSVIGENDERIGDVAPTRDAFEPDIAYNPVTNQYLVVYARPREGGGSNEFEIYGQFIDAATGALIAPTASGAEVSGTAFRISRNGNDRSTDPFDAYSPVVSYSARDNVFLVAWTADNTNPLIDCNNPDAGRAGYRAGGAFEIYVQVVAADGDLLIRDECGNPQDDRISEINVLFYQNNFESRNPDWDAFSPAVAYNSQNGEFLICWSDDRANGFLSQPFAEQGGEFEIRCQRFSLDPHPTRRFIGQIGPNDFLISRAGFSTSAAGYARPDYDAVTPAIAYNSVDNQWFVVWSADNNASGVEDGEFEIYGQVLAADGTQAHLLPGIGANYRDDHRISQIGEATGCDNASCDAYRPAVAYNPDRNQYLVAWFGDNVNGFDEVYVSLRQPTGFGTSVSGQQVSFSSNGTDNRFKGLDVDVDYDPFNREWLVVWRGDPSVNDRFEIYGQRLNADTDGSTPLATIGANFRIGTTPALAPTAFQANANGLARPLPAGEVEIASSTTLNPVNWHRVAPRLAATGSGRFMTVWAGYLNGVAADRQFEIFGRRLSFVPPTVSAVVRSDGASTAPLQDGDVVNATITELSLTFAERLRNGTDQANYRLWSGDLPSCSSTGSNLIASVSVNDATTTIVPTIQPLPDGQYTLIACATLSSVGGIALGEDVSLTFTIDTTPPTLVLPEDVTVEAETSAGAVVTFSATASDAVSGTVPVSCTPPSGSTFAIGTTTVTCTASDAAGNVASGSFTVTVEDTTAPTLTLPDNLTREASGPAGAVVTFTATASDAVSGTVPVSCTPPSGSTFAIGTTTVTCTASDAAGNVASGSFTVTITPPGAPPVEAPQHRLFVPVIVR